MGCALPSLAWLSFTIISSSFLPSWSLVFLLNESARYIFCTPPPFGFACSRYAHFSPAARLLTALCVIPSSSLNSLAEYSPLIPYHLFCFRLNLDCAIN